MKELEKVVQEEVLKLKCSIVIQMSVCMIVYTQEQIIVMRSSLVGDRSYYGGIKKNSTGRNV